MIWRIVKQYYMCLPPVGLLLVKLSHEGNEEDLHRLSVVVALQQTHIYLATSVKANNHGDSR